MVDDTSRDHVVNLVDELSLAELLDHLVHVSYGVLVVVAGDDRSRVRVDRAG